MLLLTFLCLHILASGLCFAFKPRVTKDPFTRNSIMFVPVESTYQLRSSSLDQEKEDDDSSAIRKAMLNARKNEESKSSPGAGLETAEEQAEAAYADLINTSMDQRGIDELSEEELKNLSQGGRMWERGATEKKGKFGVFGDLMNVLNAVAGGAQIEKNKYGET